MDLEIENEHEGDGAAAGSLMDFQTSHLDDVLNEKLEAAFHTQTSQVLVHDVAKIASEHDPIDLAYAVIRLPPIFRVIVYDNLPDLPAKIIFMINTGSSTSTAMFRQIDDKEISHSSNTCHPEEAVSILEDLSNRRLRRILDLLEPKKANEHLRAARPRTPLAPAV